jgi:hypothetical protein
LALETAGKLVVAVVRDPTSTTIRIASQIVKDRRLTLLLAAGFVTAYLMMLSAGPDDVGVLGLLVSQAVTLEGCVEAGPTRCGERPMSVPSGRAGCHPR